MGYRKVQQQSRDKINLSGNDSWQIVAWNEKKSDISVEWATWRTYNSKNTICLKTSVRRCNWKSPNGVKKHKWLFPNKHTRCCHKSGSHQNCVWPQNGYEQRQTEHVGKQ
jgi:hypothetical protein